MAFLLLGVLAIALSGFIFFQVFRTKRANKPTLTKYSAKLKNIYLELHNYSFFHSPEGMKKAYSRYIGRAELRKKLKAILTNSETRSGAYLVTGFRGMGKTSLVRKAIVEMKGNHYYALNRHIRIFLFLFVLHLFASKVFKDMENSAMVFLVCLSLLSMGYLAYHDNRRPNILKYYKVKYKFPRSAWMLELLKSIIRMLDPEIDFYKRSKFKVLLQDIIVVTILYIFFTWFRHIFLTELRSFLAGFVLLIVVNFVYFFLVFIYNNYTLEKADNYHRTRLMHGLRAFLRIFVNSIRRLDFGNKVVIEVSLSQDELRETDILKLLAKNIYSQYRELRNRVFTPNRLIMPVLLYSSIYLIVALLYYYKPIYGRVNEYRHSSGIVNYLPSQAEFPLFQIPEGDSTYLSFYKYKKDRSETFYQYRVYINSRISRFHASAIPNTKVTKIDPIGDRPWRDLIVILDYSLQYYYKKIFHPIIPLNGNKNIKSRPKFHRDFMFLPYSLDYFFIFLITLSFGLVTLVQRNSWRFGIINHRHILKRLKFLNESIASQITQDQVAGFGNAFSEKVQQPVTYFRRKTRAFPLAGVREIESELIDILDEIDKIPNLSTKPEFIFVFDELDKIESQYNPTIQEKESEELSSFGKDEDGYFSTESIRRRQETIARILGNLKLFFNTARAKFIFIAGREMFDASLADVSDRESFISSIFHEIIYVDSFFKDKASYEGNSNITSTTEEFVCQFLMPRFSRYSKNLNGYNEYLKDNFTRKEDTFREINIGLHKLFGSDRYKSWHDEDEEQIAKRRKAIHMVEQFITFLTYRGNGSPKKITKLLESFVVVPQEKDLLDEDYISYSRNSKNLYLHFNYVTQYRFGLTHYLFKPYLIANSNHMRDFGDKLLIATSFLMDHLYKYHRVGFSWENLELTPEIIAVNKSPDLRKFINKLISFMSGSHIEQIINGLYQFKFNVRVSSEITYISTISEVEGAAFNFTLDESLVLKRHYRKKLKSIIKTYAPFLTESYRQGNFSESIAMINMMLGDLHFYDREYDEALIHYNSALQDLSKKMDDGNYSVDELIFLVRHHLKLGLTYEKMHDYESAFSAYGGVISMLRKFSTNVRQRGANRNENIRIKKKLFENIRVIFQPLVAQFAVIEKGSPNGITGQDLLRVQDELYHIGSHLESTEKFLIESEFYNKLGDVSYYKNGALVSKSSDKVFEFDSNTYLSFSGKIKEFLKIAKGQGNQDDIISIDKDWSRDFRAPVTAFNLYKQSLKIFVKGIGELNTSLIEGCDMETGELVDLLEAARKFAMSDYYLGIADHINDSSSKNWFLRSNKQFDIVSTVASNLSDLGDTLVSFLTKDAQVPERYMHSIFLTEDGSGKVWSNETMLDKLGEFGRDGIKDGDKLVTEERIIFIYLLANQYYLRAASYYQSLLQIKKIILFIRRLCEYRVSVGGSPYTTNLVKIVQALAIEAFELIDRSAHHTRRQQIYEWEGIFKLDYGKNDEKNNIKKNEIFLRSFLYQPDAMEVYTQYKEIELGTIGSDIERLVELLNKNKIATAYGHINSKYNRIFELSYKCEIHFLIIRNLIESCGYSKEFDFVKNCFSLEEIKGQIDNVYSFSDWQGDSTEFLIYLISDSLYCLAEVLRSFNVFGITYICNHSLNAMTHEHFAYWCSLYQGFKVKSVDQKEQYAAFFRRLEETVKNILGRTDIQYLDPGYHYRMAIQHYYSAIRMHDGGKSYRDAIQNMYYLDDDLDDSLSHFCTSLERFRINNGFVRMKIRSLKKKAKDNDLFSSKNVLLDEIG